MWTAPLIALLVACWGENAYIVEGTVVEVPRPTEVVLDHKEIPGLMGPMVMPFEVVDPSLTEGLRPGTTVVARFEIEDGVGGRLTKLRVTGQTAAPERVNTGPEPVRPGGQLSDLVLPTTGGEVRIGAGQTERLALVFLYTRCPVPEFCPAVVLRMQGLQEQLGEGQRAVAITLDPEHDTLEVLGDFAASVGADPERWVFGRLPIEPLSELALQAGMPIVRGAEGDQGEIVHGLRMLIIDHGGRLIERYDDNFWPLDRVVTQLSTGAPAAPSGSHGTVSTPPEAISGE